MINFLLKCDISRKSKFKLITIANRYPDFLSDVSQQILTRTNFGFNIFCDRRDVIGQTIIETGQWEGLMSRTIQASLSPGDCAMDIGANMGYDSLLMSQTVGATGSVIAFEPDHNNLRRLLENTKNLQFQNVAIVSLALADIESVARIEIANIENTGQSNLRHAESNSLSQPVLVSRLENLMELETPINISLVKIDVEGFEFKVIKGMGNYLDSIQALTCEINHEFLEQCGSSAKELVGHMNENGFVSFCAEANSNDRWEKSDFNFNCRLNHFDVLFSRKIGARIDALIK
ncbi:MAG: FkbM family methyltransferase [Dechloromonas sp.]|uniref:FkbM family methyltransferase n=1 Tax=Candidatus Dechloromonas phosphorivorans TaxID=2899244 RepID=A0A9D7LXE2_9RHOO|nr:FkbM family methyltransferase [Candidatus Dechloromonas phosphorivorans]